MRKASLILAAAHSLRMPMRRASIETPSADVYLLAVNMIKASMNGSVHFEDLSEVNSTDDDETSIDHQNLSSFGEQ